MIKYYKNNSRFTAIFPNGRFIQVNTLVKVEMVTTGENRYIIHDCQHHEVEIDELTFLLKLNETMKVVAAQIILLPNA